MTTNLVTLETPEASGVVCYSYLESPLGDLCVRGDGCSITGLFLPQHKRWDGPATAWRRADDCFDEVRRQLAEYFAGERTAFDVPLKLTGTPFQRRVWEELLQIPFGETVTYQELARRLGKPSASRAVGHANGCNPVSILVPCHRVVGASGKLTGYAGGLARKRWLLEWERSVQATSIVARRASAAT